MNKSFSFFERKGEEQGREEGRRVEKSRKGIQAIDPCDINNINEEFGQ